MCRSPLIFIAVTLLLSVSVVYADKSAEVIGEDRATMRLVPADQSPYGIYDLSGNVRECTDSDHESKGGTVARGGSWFSSPQTLQAIFRISVVPSSRNSWLGFRCVQPASGFPPPTTQPAKKTRTWVCSRPRQPDLYVDHGGPGCSEVADAKTYSPLQTAPTRSSLSRPPIDMAHPSTSNMPSHGSAMGRPPSPFPEVSISFPIVTVNQPIQGSITGSWMGLMVRLTVGHLMSGTGPEIVTDGNLKPVSLASLKTAVIVAATAVGYDPKFLKVRLLVPTGVDGPSAGGMYAVAIASALLGDEIRGEVCMSGTIEPTLEIKPVGRLTDKMHACQQLKKTVMIVPEGVDNSHLSFQGAERAIHVIEVHTLAEAYAAATGQVLRQGSL